MKKVVVNLVMVFAVASTAVSAFAGEPIKDVVPCMVIKKLVSEPSKLAEITSAERVYTCTGKMLIYVTPFVTGEGYLVPAHYELRSVGHKSDEAK